MKIVGISGSSRKGNSEWMLEKLLDDAVRNGAQAELVLLRRLNIKKCTGCLSCEAGGKARKGYCSLQDDMQTIYPKLLSADAVVLATPVYFEMLSGLLKNFLDRTCPVWPQLSGKSAAGLAVAEEGIGQAIRNLQTYASVCGMKWVGSVTALAKNPGEAAQDEKLPPRLNRLAKKLAAGA